MKDFFGAPNCSLEYLHCILMSLCKDIVVSHTEQVQSICKNIFNTKEGQLLSESMKRCIMHNLYFYLSRGSRLDWINMQKENALKTKKKLPNYFSTVVA